MTTMIDGHTVFYIALTKVRGAAKPTMRMHHTRNLYQDPAQAKARCKSAGGGVVLIIDLETMLIQPLGMSSEEEYQFFEAMTLEVGKRANAARARAAAGEKADEPAYEKRKPRKRRPLTETQRAALEARTQARINRRLGQLAAPFLAGLAGAAIGNLLSAPKSKESPAKDPFGISGLLGSPSSTTPSPDTKK